MNNCRVLCKSIDQCRVVFIKRLMNHITHSLIKAFNYMSGQKIFDIYLLFISNVLAEHLNE